MGRFACKFASGFAGLCAIAGCGGSESEPGAPGSVDLRAVHVASASSEDISFAGPPGAMHILLSDSGTSCNFLVTATSDAAKPASQQQFRVLVTAKQAEISDLFAGKPQEVSAHGALFASDSTLVLERDSQARVWFSGAGTLEIDALPPVGELMTIHVNAVQMKDAKASDDLVLDGTIVGTYKGAGAPLSGAQRACPAM